MPYNNTIKDEATYLADLGPTATEDKFHALYRAILNQWFPSSKGYLMDLGGEDQWNETGRLEVRADLEEFIEGTQNNTIYGLGAIGLHWMVCKMEKSGLDELTIVMDWREDISSDESYDDFKTIVVDNIR